jgi:type I restriction enzyme S subunit
MEDVPNYQSSLLPKDWVSKKLEDVCEITSSKRIFESDYVNEGIPFYRTKEIRELSEGQDISVDLFISEEKYREIKNNFDIPQAGDLLVSAVGTIGISYIIKDNSPFYFKDGNLVWIKKLEGVLPKYLHYYIVHFIRFRNSIAMSGSAYNALTIIKLKSFNISLPPLSQQTLIVNKIEEIFSELDKSIEQLKTAQQQLKVYRQSVLQWAFEGKLTNEGVREGELPEGWEYRTLKELKQFSIYGPRFSSKDYADSGVAVLRTTDIDERGKVDWINAPKLALSDHEFEKYKLVKGDLLITRTGSIGTISIFNDDKKAIPGAFLIHYRLHDTVSPNFIFYFLKTKEAQDHFKKYSFGVGRPNLNVPNIELLRIPFMPLMVQMAVIQEIEARLSVSDKMEETITQSLEQAEALKQSILKRAFEGKLTE